MEKSTIVEVLSEWNPWNRELKTGVPRKDYLERIERLHKTGQVVAITGVRRAGKSTLLKQYMKKIAAKHGPDKILYINFEEPLFNNAGLDFLLKAYDAYREHVNPKGGSFIFLDEVQKVDGWEKFARAQHEKQVADVFVSGSTSSLLSKEYGTLLTGRHVDLRVFPFSFSEFLGARGLDGKKALFNKYETANKLGEYLQWGGFPKAVFSDEKRIVLSAYFEDIVSKDIIERYKIRETEKVRELARFYLSNTSALHSFNKLSKTLSLSVDTVDRCTGYFAEAFLFFFVKRFSYSLHEQSVNPRKTYCIDNGLREAVAFKFSKDIGKTIENAVALELLRRGKEIFYYKQKKTDFEVDFVVREGDKITEAIQVSRGGAEKREERALDAIEKELQPKKITMISIDALKTPGQAAVPLWKWLLNIT